MRLKRSPAWWPAIQNVAVFAAFAAAAVSFCCPARAAEVSLTAASASTQFLEISGVIEQGDARKVAAAIAGAKLIASVQLSSPGGDVVEAVEIGELVRAARLDTGVAKLSYCASACFFIWMNGATRFASSDPRILGRVGLHRPYLAATGNDDEHLSTQLALQRAVGKYLEDRMIPRRLVDLMMSRPSNMVYWMTDADIAEMGSSPPDLEELYIARCGWKMRQWIAERTFARDTGDRAAVARVDEEIQAALRCQIGLNHAATLSVQHKLQRGWMPKNPLTIR